MTTSIRSRAKAGRSLSHVYSKREGLNDPDRWSSGRGFRDASADDYRAARTSLRTAREFATMLNALRNVKGNKRAKAIYMEGYLSALQSADYYRKSARNWRDQGRARILEERRKKRTQTKRRR